MRVLSATDEQPPITGFVGRHFHDGSVWSPSDGGPIASLSMTFSDRAARRCRPPPAYDEMVDATIGRNGWRRGARRDGAHAPAIARPDAASLRRLYVEEGMTVAALGARLGVVTRTAHNWLVAADVPRRAPPATVRVDVSDVEKLTRSPLRREVRRLYAVEGWTAAEVAAHLGCGTSTVYGRLQGLGVSRRPARPRRARGPRTPSCGVCTWSAGSVSASSPSGSR